MATKRWSRPLYDGAAINLRVHTTTVLHDKLLVFGGIRSVESIDSVFIDLDVGTRSALTKFGFQGSCFSSMCWKLKKER